MRTRTQYCQGHVRTRLDKDEDAAEDADTATATDTAGQGHGMDTDKDTDEDSRRQQVTCFLPYPSKVTPTTISLPIISKETKLVIGGKLLSLGRPSPKTSLLSGK